MSLSKKPYKGCRDFYPQQMQLRNFMFNKVSSCAKLYGYQQYDAPLLEEVKLYLAKSGEELIGEQIYDFTDKGKRHVAIRPEMTPSVARMIASIHKQESKPIRWYSIANFMRYERPQKGRLREFSQLNLDIFGASETHSSVEIFQYIISLFTSFGANEKQFKIHLNDRRILDSLLNDQLKLDNESKLKLYKIVDKSKKMKPEVLDDELDKVLGDQKLIFKKYLNAQTTEDIQELGINLKDNPLIEVLNVMKELKLDQYISYDASIVRGLDYYTGIVFEIFDMHPENRRALGGGGAYANLLQIFNEPALAGVGIGLGDVPLEEFLNSHQLTPTSYVTQPSILIGTDSAVNTLHLSQLAMQLRKEDIRTEVLYEPAKFNKVSKFANTKEHTWMIYLEDKSELKIRNLKDKSSSTFDSIDAVISFLKESL